MATIFEDRPAVIERKEAQDFDPHLMDTVALKAVSRLLSAWKVDQAAAATLVGVRDRTWARMKSGSWSGELNQDQRMRISGLVGLYQGLHVYFSDDLADRWVQLRNEGDLFRGVSPLALMLEGGLPAILTVRDYVDALRGGL